MWRIRVVLPPLNVTLSPPSMTVFLVMGTSDARVIVAGSLPQLNVTTPPVATAARNAESVQLAAVPLPTTVVGFEVSAGFAGESQSGFGGGGGTTSGFEPTSRV